MRCGAVFVVATIAVQAQDVRVGSVAGQANVQADQPLASGDRIWTGTPARVDLLIDPSVSLRIYPNSEIHVTRRDDGAPRLEIAQGEMLSSVVDLPPVLFEIGTPQVGVRPSMPGSVRVLVDQTGQSEITALTSDVQVVALPGSQWLLMGQKMYVRGTAADPEFRIVSAIGVAYPVTAAAIDTIRVVGAVSTGARPAAIGVLLPPIGQPRRPPPHPRRPPPKQAPHPPAAQAPHTPATRT